MIAAEADFGDVIRRHPPGIGNLIAKAAENMRFQQLGHLLPGKPATVVKDVHAGRRVPATVEHRFGDARIEIAAMQLFSIQRMNPRTVAGN